VNRENVIAWVNMRRREAVSSGRVWPLRSDQAIPEFPEITWEHSHVIVRDNGSFRQFCVYRAPDPETLRSHGKRLGAHRIDDIWEIAGDVTPADFPAAR
jgi:hypothetical protein